MTVHGSRGAASACLVIRKQRSGEVLLEVTPSSFSSSSSTSRVPSAAEGKESSLFSDAFAFIAEAQAKTYDFFGRNMVKESGKMTAADTTGTRARRENYVDAMMSCDAPSSSFLDSAEWEGDGTNDKSVSFGDGDGDEENGDDHSESDTSTTHSNEVDPPAKRRFGISLSGREMTEEYLQTFAAGTVSGVVGVLLEYPLDTIKVRLQAYTSRYNGYLDCAVKLVREEGFRSFYSGVSTRIIGSGFEHAVVFSFYKSTLRLVGADEYHPLAWQIILGGVGGGVASTTFLTPLELVKCHLQVANMRPVGQREYSGVMDCIMKIARREGVAGLYKGGVAMLAREVPGTAAYCGTYDKTKEFLTPPGTTTAELSPWRLMIAGGCSGVAFWTVFFPADVVKTRMQVDPTFTPPGFMAALRLLYAEGGMRALYCGWTLTAIRAFPSNAAIFATYDLCMRSMRKQDHHQH